MSTRERNSNGVLEVKIERDKQIER
jgi:hypothetical protein